MNQLDWQIDTQPKPNTEALGEAKLDCLYYEVFSGAMSGAEIGDVLGGLREKGTDSAKTCI